MNDEVKTAETTEETSVVDSHADVNQTTENVNDVEFTDSTEAEGTAETEAPKAQTKEQNSENARRRREAEHKAAIEKAKSEARMQAIIEALDGKNPYTGEEIKDQTDVDEYLTMKEIERSGGEPLADYSKFQKKKLREEEAKRAEEDKQAEWYRADREEFTTKHPETDLNALVKDKSFQAFAEGKVGRVPLSQIYEGFLEFTAQYEKKANKKAAQLVANKNASPGSLSSTNTPEDGYFTREQVLKMSQDEVEKNLDKIRASMPKWK